MGGAFFGQTEMGEPLLHALNVQMPLPLASTRGDQASRVSAPFSKERTVCPPTKTTSPSGWALDSELAAKFLPTRGWPALLLRLCSSSLIDGPWFQAGLGLCWGRALPKGKMMWAIATGHRPEEPKAV